MVSPLATAAVSWSFSAAGWFVAPAISRMLTQCFDALGMDVTITRSKDILDKLDRLGTTILPLLLILTDAAEKSDHRPILGRWLQKLKSAYYEVEHALGLVEYERLENEVNSLFPSKSNIEKMVEILPEQLESKISFLFPSTSNSTIEKITEMLPEQLTSSLFPSTSKSVIENVKEMLPELSSGKKHLIKSLKNLEDVVDEAIKLLPILNLPSSGRVNDPNERPYGQYRPTVSTPVSRVIGRDNDRDYIVKLLRENDPSESTSYAKCYSVIGIWGMGGLGKTTLAQYVCEHEKEAKYFDCILWVHVSENFSVRAIWVKILESDSKGGCPSFIGLEGLKSRVEDKLRGKMFLLVLDDVWCDKNVSQEELEQLFAPLRAGKRGSKILVTTRIEGAAKALGDMNPIRLQELDGEQFFSLFMINALGDAQIRDNRLNKKLTEIGKQIAAKLLRSPLAAKIVAGQLRTRVDPKFWSHVLKSSLLNDTMGALFLSYRHLPPPLQRCFAFCSLFPKGYYFFRDDLINLWIAEGFIETGSGEEHMKDIADWYLLDLISSSFFQIDEHKCHCYVHDLMHDLAQYVSEGEFFRIESGEEKEIPAHTRHIFVESDKLGEYVDKMCKLEDLCTIIISHVKGYSLNEVNLDTLFSKLRKLRVLRIRDIDFKRVDKSIVHLRNLRYLNFDQKVEEDANFNLLNKLYQLRVLEIKNQIPHVGRLISLQHFQKFYVRKGMGHELKQLEHLKDLYGFLYINGLDVVESKEEAESAKLSEKKNLHRLYYQWNTGSGDVVRQNDAQILDGLCPPSEIRDLNIEGYSDTRFPSWILRSNNIIHLECLTFANCPFLETLPKIHELSHLLSLGICYLPMLKRWEPLPSDLTQLRLYDCFSLSFVLNEDLEKIMAARSMQIPRLVTFLESCQRGRKNNCFNFQRFCVEEMMKMRDHVDEQALSMISQDMKYCIEKRLDLICQISNAHGELYLPPSLEELLIRSCCLTDSVLTVSLQNLNFLTNLYLEDIITMTCITNDVLSSLTSLIDLTIKQCLLLTSIGGWDTHSSLVKLQIEQCPSLILKSSIAAISCHSAKLTPSSCREDSRSGVLKDVSLLQVCEAADDVFQNLVSVETITVTDCPTIKNLHVGYLVSLVLLEFNECPNFISMRGLTRLNGLKQLRIFNCPKVQCYSKTDKLPWLKELSINKFSQIEHLISIDGLSSLISLELSNAQEEYFSQQDCQMLCYLSSLETIRFYDCQMRSLPNLQCVRSLRYLEIKCCGNLTSLSGLPRSVQGFSIFNCNKEFTRSCKDTNDPNWRMISYIPDKRIEP